jgi:hypothetical protein
MMAICDNRNVSEGFDELQEIFTHAEEVVCAPHENAKDAIDPVSRRGQIAQHHVHDVDCKRGLEEPSICPQVSSKELSNICSVIEGVELVNL